MLLLARTSLAAITLGVLIAGPIASAQETTDKEEDPSPKQSRRAVSKNVAAALAARMPKYSPPKPVEKKKAIDGQDMRDIDTPRNKIIRLPEYVVRERKAPVFREQDIYTEKGLKELAAKRYFSTTNLALNKFTLPLVGIGAEAYALMLYQQDERLKNISDLNESADDVSLIDEDSAEEIRKVTRETYHRGFGNRRKRN